ncbi:MAG: hypothetical protein KY466_16295 [Gemmatimonadetes bacterium]|nr:hypothetical protein [Gemmatimonadota bacterium]
MIELRVLGTTSLRDSQGGEIGPVLAQPKRLALLAYLAVARPRGFHRRSTLLALFWPERDERHARWALNQAVRHLRTMLGGDVVHSRGADEVALDFSAIQSDAAAFEAAFGEQRWEEALHLYRGDLLRGFHVAGCPEFLHWMEDERTRLRTLAARAASALTDRLEAEGHLIAAAESARGAVELAPYDEQNIRRLLHLLDRTGDRAGAVQGYEDYARRLREALEVEPAPETQALIGAVRSREEAPRPEPASPVAGPVTQLGPGSGGENLEAGPDAVSRTRRIRALSAFFAVTALVFTAGLSWTLGSWSSTSVRPNSIAVLPCSTTVQDPRKEYLGGLVTEDLIAEVAESRLFDKVIASASVARYRGTTNPPREIGTQLGVEALLYCVYRQVGSLERVRVQLVDARTATILWMDGFERELTATIEATLPTLIVEGLSVALGGAEPAGGGRSWTTDPRALDLYNEGRSYLRQFTNEALRQSIYRFNEAIALDSTFAAAHLGVAQAYFYLGIAHGGLEPREAFPLMRQGARNALALDDSLAEAHALLAEYEMAFGWNWKEAERRLRRAIQLQPDSPTTLRTLAYYLTLVGRYEEAFALDARGLELSPLDPAAWGSAGHNRLLAGQFDAALPLLQRGLELAPDFHPFFLIAGLIHAELGEMTRAVEYLQRADSISGGQVIIRGRLGYVHALAGDSAAARAILRELQEGATGTRPPAKTATAIAVVHIALGQPDSAFAWLDAAYRQRSGNLVHVLRTPAGWRLASDPRYTALLEGIGLRPRVLTPIPAGRNEFGSHSAR